MKLKAKVLVFIVLICVLFLSLFFLLFQVILADHIKEQKNLRARQLMEGALSVFENETKRLLTFCEDYAGWDSMYRYVSQPNQAFEQELAPRLTLRDADLSLLLVTNKKKEILLAEAYHNAKDEYIPFTLLGQKKGSLWNYLEDTFTMKRSITGIVNSQYGPMLAVSSPVLRSNGSGPQNGRILMGRFIDKTFEKKITAVIRENTHLSMEPPPQTQAPTTTQQKADGDFMLTEEVGHMHIRHTVKDVKDHPAFTIQVGAQKQIFEILEHAARLFFLHLVGGFFLFGVILYFINDRLVIRRIKTISAETNRIISLENLSLQVPVNYRDEITLLGQNINQMLQRLQTENLHKEEIEHMLALNEKLIFLGKVTANIAHEVNNPLFAIANSLQMIKKHLPADNEKVNKVAQLAERETRRVRNMMQDIHQLTMRDIEEPALSDIAAVISAAINVLKWSKQLKNTRVDFKKYDHFLPLYCKPESLQQVFMNIIVNAVEAMAGEGELVIDVEEYEDEEGEKYRINFIDTGPGFSPDIKKRLFVPFKTTKAGKGTGLGLYVSHNIILNHEGSITLDDTYKKGAHLVVEIPKKGDPNHVQQ